MALPKACLVGATWWISLFNSVINTAPNIQIFGVGKYTQDKQITTVIRTRSQ